MVISSRNLSFFYYYFFKNQTTYIYICILNTCFSDYKGKDHFTVNWSVLKDITVGQKLKPKMFYSRYLILGTVVAFKPHVKVPSTKYAVSRGGILPWG